MKYHYLPFAAAFALSVAGCATDMSDGTSTSVVNNNREEISGVVKRTDANPLEVGAILEVSVQDVSLADAASTTLKKDFWPINGRETEFPFTLSVSKQDLENCSSMRYQCSISASIKGSGDKLLYTNDVRHDFPNEDGKYVVRLKKVHEDPVGF